MTANYNTIHLGDSKTTYRIGQIFEVDIASPFVNWRVKVFNGLRIVDITHNFGQVLHFDLNQWLDAREGFDVPKKTK